MQFSRNNTLLNSQFLENHSQFSGAWYLIECTYTYYRNMSIKHNWSSKDGGAINDLYGSNMEARDSVFYNNTSQFTKAGTIYQFIGNHYLYDNVTFENNFAYLNGGVFFIETCKNITIQNSVFLNNTAVHSLAGAVFLLTTQKFSTKNTLFQDNYSF